MNMIRKGQIRWVSGDDVLCQIRFITLQSGYVRNRDSSLPSSQCCQPFKVATHPYDPITGTFTLTGDMTEPGCETATVLANGKVLIARLVGYGPPNHAELYDPATGTFTRTGSMVYPDQGIGPAAVLLPSGKVLIADGFLDYDFSARAELYDPATGAFTPASDMAEGLMPETATLLGDDRRLGGRGPVIRHYPDTRL